MAQECQVPYSFSPAALDACIDDAQPDEILMNLLPHLTWQNYAALKRRFEYLYMSTEIDEHEAIYIIEYIINAGMMVKILDDPHAPKKLKEQALQFAEEWKNMDAYLAVTPPKPGDERACLVMYGEKYYAKNIILEWVTNVTNAT